MKVLLCSTYLPPFAGGAENMAAQLAQGLLKKGCEVSFFSTTKSFGSLTTHSVPYRPGLTIHYSLFSKKIRDVLEKNSFDIVHSHLALPWGYVFRKSAASKVITCHGSDVYPPKNIFMKHLVSSSLASSDAVVSPSRWLADYMLDEYEVSSHKISNGVDTNLFSPQAVGESNVVLFVGRFIPLKGVDILLEAARALPDYEFWFVGTGPLSENIILPNTKNLGLVSQEKLVALYNAAAVCVFPSERENNPLVALEAMACGKAVIATQLGFSEIITDGQDGILLKERSAKAIVDSIRLLEDGTFRKKIENNARKRIVTDFSVASMVTAYHTLYQEALA